MLEPMHMGVNRKTVDDIYMLQNKSKVKRETNFINILLHRKTCADVFVLLGTVLIKYFRGSSLDQIVEILTKSGYQIVLHCLSRQKAWRRDIDKMTSESRGRDEAG